MVHFYSTTIIGRHKGNDHLRAALQGYSKVHFFPSPPLGKGEKVGHPTPRQGATAPWNPAFSDLATALPLREGQKAYQAGLSSGLAVYIVL